jgi:hypothetical protein
MSPEQMSLLDCDELSGGKGSRTSVPGLGLGESLDRVYTSGPERTRRSRQRSGRCGSRVSR